MTEQTWTEFLDKLDFAQLTGRWSLLPLHWLDDEVPAGLDDEEAALYQGLVAIPKDHEDAAKAERVVALVGQYRQALAGRRMTLDASLCPPGSRVSLSYLDPDNLGSGDCLITVGSWDRLGCFIAEIAGLQDERAEPSESAVRKEPGDLDYRHLLLFPERGTPSPRAFRSLCEKTLRQARGLGARRISMTHLHLPQPGLPDRFAAAELVSAVRQMLRDGTGITVEIMVLTRSNYDDYRHWFLSLAELARGQSEAISGTTSLAPNAPSESARSESLEPVVATALRDFAHKTSHLAQEASREVSSWFRGASTSPISTALQAPSAAMSVELDCSFADQQALNLLYLGQWKEAEAYRERWDLDSLLGLYLAALYRVVVYLDSPESAAPSPPEIELADDPASPSQKQQSGQLEQPKEVESAEHDQSEETAQQDSVDDSELEDDGPVEEKPEPSADPESAPDDTERTETTEKEPMSEYQQLRRQLLSTAHTLGSNNPLTRYFLLLAWRLDRQRPDCDPDQLEEDHARLLRAAWVWEDNALLAFLRQVGQDQEKQAPSAHRGYVPVFPTGSRSTPRPD